MNIFSLVFQLKSKGKDAETEEKQAGDTVAKKNIASTEPFSFPDGKLSSFRC